jgi:hypothetical protein
MQKNEMLRDFAAAVHLSEAPPPPYTLYTSYLYTVYTYSHREGGEGES